MKYILPKKLRFSKKDEIKFNKFLKKIRPYFIMGLIHGVVAIGLLLLYHYVLK